jgi:hypothetical protein
MQFTSTQKRAAAWLLIAARGRAGAVAAGAGADALCGGGGAGLCAHAAGQLARPQPGRGALPRVVAVLVVELLFIVDGCWGVLLLIVPILAKEMPLLREQVPVLFDKLNTWLQPLLAQLGIKLSLDVAKHQGLCAQVPERQFRRCFGLAAVLAQARRQRGAGRCWAMRC